MLGLPTCGSHVCVMELVLSTRVALEGMEDVQPNSGIKYKIQAEKWYNSEHSHEPGRKQYEGNSRAGNKAPTEG